MIFANIQLVKIQAGGLLDLLTTNTVNRATHFFLQTVDVKMKTNIELWYEYPH
jgi:hypothetical protein